MHSSKSSHDHRLENSTKAIIRRQIPHRQPLLAQQAEQHLIIPLHIIIRLLAPPPFLDKPNRLVQLLGTRVLPVAARAHPPHIRMPKRPVDRPMNRLGAKALPAILFLEQEADVGVARRRVPRPGARQHIIAIAIADAEKANRRTVCRRRCRGAHVLVRRPHACFVGAQRREQDDGADEGARLQAREHGFGCFSAEGAQRVAAREGLDCWVEREGKEKVDVGGGVFDGAVDEAWRAERVG